MTNRQPPRQHAHPGNAYVGAHHRQSGVLGIDMRQRSPAQQGAPHIGSTRQSIRHLDKHIRAVKRSVLLGRNQQRFRPGRANYLTQQNPLLVALRDGVLYDGTVSAHFGRVCAQQAHRHTTQLCQCRCTGCCTALPLRHPVEVCVFKVDGGTTRCCDHTFLFCLALHALAVKHPFVTHLARRQLTHALFAILGRDNHQTPTRLDASHRRRIGHAHPGAAPWRATRHGHSPADTSWCSK